MDDREPDVALEKAERLIMSVAEKRVTRDFRSRAASADARGNLDRSEGRIEGDGNKSGDVKTVGETTAAGAGTLLDSPMLFAPNGP